jgi:uncharacterized protein (TIGR02687 family)
MAKLNLKQIINKLNTEFTEGEQRKIVFWYDDNGDFVDRIDDIILENAKVYKLTRNNQFKTKLFLENEDTTTNYLIYAPFSKPYVTENHLEDILLYSKRFYADRVSLICTDLGIGEKYKPLLNKHIDFFSDDELYSYFCDLEIENYNEENIITGIMCSICKTRICSFEEVVRVMMIEDSLTNSKYMADFEKYNVEDDFWRYCEELFGLSFEHPNLEKMVISLFVTYADRYIRGGVPKDWKRFLSLKVGNIIAFLDNLMNNIIYRDRYDELSLYVADCLNANEEFEKYDLEDIVECDSFVCIDKVIIGWLIERLRSEDCLARLGGYNVVELCEKREKMHFGRNYQIEYAIIYNAFGIISNAKYEVATGLENIIKKYIEQDCSIDTYYRNFYYNYDRLDNVSQYEDLRDLVENIYTNEYLGKLLPKWNEGILEKDSLSKVSLQRNFYNSYVKNNIKTIVFISDGMRYEVGKELYEKMIDNPRCNAKFDVMLSTLPSYTRLGMEALLPHETLKLTDDFKEIVDGKYAIDLDTRQSVLQSHIPNSKCMRFNDLKALKGHALREAFNGLSVVYVFCDHIDNAGEHTVEDIFEYCVKSVDEIATWIEKIALNGNVRRFVVTADHGFIYKRDKVTESDKIGGMSDSQRLVKRRYIVSKEAIKEDGVCNISLGYILGNEDDKIVSFPYSTSVFSIPGNAELNYVHGGSSPQEMLVPVIDIYMDKWTVETRSVQIMLISLIQKITNLITTLDFIQSEPISDVIKATTYKIYFVSDDDEKISNENVYIADKRDEDVSKRIFRMRFTFKNKKYDKSRKYYLVAYDENDKEVIRHEVIMDLAFSNDFGFDV